MDLATEVIKRRGRGHSEPFIREKLQKSIVAACLSVHMPVGQAEKTAHSVCDEVIAWVKQHPEVTSHDIRITAAKHLKKYHHDAGYIYEQNRITM